MFTSISHSQLWVLDQDEALDFYVGKLGFTVHVDADIEVMRWLTVVAPGDPDHELVLMVPAPPAVDAESVAQVGELVAKGNGGMVILRTDDCQATFEELRAKGVEFTQEPLEHFYGTDCALRDPFGNHIRITQPAPQPVQVPTPAATAG